ncbi:hypothetical protein ABBQ38_010752 [Trebouxia sp. C0009 RCD-2024]
MPVKALCCAFAPVRPTKCKEINVRRFRRSVVIGIVLGASARYVMPDHRAKHSPRSLSGGTLFGVDSTPLWKRLQESVPIPAHCYTNFMLVLTSTLLPDVMRSQDKLAPLLLRNAPVACFAINVLTWGRLGYLHEDQAGYGRTAAVFVASWAAQIAMRHALSLAPLPTPWPTLSGAVFGLLGAKTVYDVRHT